jgi:hypothetical protein
MYRSAAPAALPFLVLSFRFLPNYKPKLTKLSPFSADALAPHPDTKVSVDTIVQ